MNKKGQIYIITSIIIIIILIGLSGITNRAATRQQPAKFFGFGDNLEREGYSLYDYGKYNKVDIPSILNQFTDSFKKYIQTTGENAEFVTIYGNSLSATYTIYGYPGGTRGDLGSQALYAGTGELQIISQQTIANPGNTLSFTFKEEDYIIPLTADETFLFIFTKSEGLNKWIDANTQIS